MDHFHHVAGKHRPRPQRHTSSSRYRDWEPRHESPLDSLPYRTLKPGVQRPDDRKLKHSSHRRTPLSEDLHVRGPMPPQPQLLIRSSTVAHRGPKGRLPYDADDDDDDEEEDEEEDDDDDDDGGEQQRLRARLRSRSRTRARTRSVSSSRDSDSVVMTTPTRSTHAYRSAPVSRHVSSASEGSSSADSSSSESTQDARKRHRSRSLKERIQVPAVPDPISAIEEPPPSRRRHGRHGRRGRNVVHLEQIHAEPEYEEPDTIDLKPASTGHHRVQSESRSRSRRQHRHLDHYSEGHPSSSSRRPMMRRYYESDAGYPPRTLLPRSHHTSRSRVPSLRSVSTSSRRSSFLGGFFAPAIHPHPSDKPAKTVECIVCLDDLPTSQAPKLKCGHRMCKTCLKRVFKISIKDPQQMPPRCCTSECIPLKYVDKIFKDDFKRVWNRKFAEFSTRNRVYCPGKKCGEWIKPDQIHRHRNGRKIAKCSKCGTRVCCACNNKWHESKHCPTDADTDLILQQAKEHGWQRCFRCKDMVELKEGCNHMTCRCGAEFCMICGAKWKTCECPWFSYDTAEHDGLDGMDIPVPMVDRDRLGGSDTFPNYRAGTAAAQGARFRPTTYEEEMHFRHAQEQQDEEMARRLQYEDTDDEYLDGMGDVMGVGNATGHFMNDNYRRAQSVIAPQPPPAAPMSTFERANSTITDYVTGVKRSRGFRSSSMERRLADRFEQRQNSTTPHRAFGSAMPPPPHAPRSMGPPPPPQPPGMPTNGMRRHTVEDDIYDPSRNPRLAERMTPRRAATQDYLEEIGVYAPTSRRRHREREPPRDSVLAGLTGQGRGMNRVFEWRNHVDPTGTEHHITAS